MFTSHVFVCIAALREWEALEKWNRNNIYVRFNPYMSLVQKKWGHLSKMSAPKIFRSKTAWSREKNNVWREICLKKESYYNDLITPKLSPMAHKNRMGQYFLRLPWENLF